MTCEHENFIAEVDVNRLTKDDGGPVAGFSADVRIRCADCQEPFVFRGATVGLLPTKPCMSADALELHAPVLPQSADPNFGLGLAGVAMRVREGAGETSN